MKKTNKLLTLATIMLAMTSCNDNEQIIPHTQYISIDASIGEMSRVSNDKNGPKFDSGDQISVFAWTGDKSEIPSNRIVDGSVNTYDGNKWTASPQMLWADYTSEHYFLAVYPSQTISDFKAGEYTLDPKDQMKSDLLIATNTSGLTFQTEPVQLTFSHAMAKLVVNLKFRNQWGGTPTVESVKYTGYTEATVDYLSKTVTGTTTDDVTLTAATAAENFDLGYTSIVIPSNDTKTIKIRIDNIDYKYDHPNNIPLESGKYTTINLNVGRDIITLANVSISEWVSNGEPISGEAQN